MKLRVTATTIIDVPNIPEAAKAYHKFEEAFKDLEKATGSKFELDMRETREVTRRKRGEK